MADDVCEILQDPERLETLRRTALADSETEESFDRLVRLAARMLCCPIALVTLVEGRRQFLKSAVGLPAPWATLRSTPLPHSFCQHPVISHRPLVVEDARTNPAVAESLALPALDIIAYAGVPLITSSGHALGALCVMDSRPRKWNSQELETLRDLAASAMTEIELRTTATRSRKLAAEIARERSEKQALLDAAADGLLGVDAGGRCTFVNPAATRLLGYAMEELLGVELEKILAPYPHEEETGVGAAVPLGTEAETIPVWRELTVRRKDGILLLVEVSVSPLRESGKLGRLVSFRDISERSRVERFNAGQQRLLEMVAAGRPLPIILEALARLIEAQVTGILCSVLLVDDEGRLRDGAGPNLPVEYRQAIDGLQIGERVGSCGTAAFRRRQVIVSDIARDPLWEPFRDLAARHALGACWSTPITSSRFGVIGTFAMYYREPRAPQPFELQLIDTAVHLAGIAIERWRVEAERARSLEREKAARSDAERERRRAEEASRVKDEFLATISHELRTPLTSILGWVQMIRSGRLAEEKLDRALRSVERGARAQKQLIEELLDISRIESGKLRLEMRAVAPHAIMESALDAIRPAAEARGLFIESALDLATGCVLADPQRLQQVVWNLLSNAVKFTPRGGRVLVRLRELEGWVQIEVEDTGEGIAPDFLPNVFERFRQGDTGSKRAYGGLGLGLSIARHFVELHGGTVRAASAGKGRGATFMVCLPLLETRGSAVPCFSDAPM